MDTPAVGGERCFVVAESGQFGLGLRTVNRSLGVLLNRNEVQPTGIGVADITVVSVRRNRHRIVGGDVMHPGYNGQAQYIPSGTAQWLFFLLLPDWWNDCWGSS